MALAAWAKCFARDSKLNRDIAIKVLLPAVASDPDRLARFSREAHVLASLNHPNIAAIYGLEESGDVRALVMELVEGPTLAERMGTGLGPHVAPRPVPIDEALASAKQIADALEAAHEQGIIHRDLKPANIKVLDFGLAKAIQADGFRSGSSRDPSPLSMSPTLTTPALAGMMTGVGVILGTAAYMSPEQARGKAVDRRADVWAFGVRSLREAHRTARVRGRRRHRDAGERHQRRPGLDGAARGCAGAHRHATAQLSGQGPAPPLWRRAAVTAAAVAITALVTGAIVRWLSRPVPASVVRTAITTSGTTSLSLNGTDRDVAITPDGSRVVYRGNNQLLVRALNQLEPTVLGGLGVPRGVFVSPDGQWIGFFDGTQLKKMAITGGPPVTIAPVAGGTPRGATWGPDGTIIFATFAGAGLQRVSAAGGDPAVLAKPERASGASFYYWPEFLPGGKAVLFAIMTVGDPQNALIAVLDLRTGASKVLVRGGSHAHYVSMGHLVYGVSGTLRAAAFDLERLEVTGTPAPVLEGVVTTSAGATDVAVAANGSFVYVPGAGAVSRQTVVAVDRQGKASPLPGVLPDSYRDVRVSPDGARLALASGATPSNMILVLNWTEELKRLVPVK